MLAKKISSTINGLVCVCVKEEDEQSRGAKRNACLQGKEVETLPRERGRKGTGRKADRTTFVSLESMKVIKYKGVVFNPHRNRLLFVPQFSHRQDSDFFSGKRSDVRLSIQVSYHLLNSLN